VLAERCRLVGVRYITGSVQSSPSSSMTEEEMDRMQLSLVPSTALHSCVSTGLVAAAAAAAATTTVATASTTAAARASSAVAAAAAIA
jgi:hypothetical protein